MATIGSETSCGAEYRAGKLVKGLGWGTLGKDDGCVGCDGCMNSLVKVIQKVPMLVGVNEGPG